MASACGPKSSRRSSAALPKAKKSRVSDWPTIATLANAHAVLVSSCALKSATCHSAAIANTVDSSAPKLSNTMLDQAWVMPDIKHNLA